MRALVTGGAGFIGSHLVDRLLGDGCAVRVLDSLEPRVHPSGRPTYLPSEIDFVEGDVRDRGAVSQALADVDVVFHQAAYQDLMPNYSRFFDTNATGTALLYEVIESERLPVRKVVVASSQAVYGEGEYACAEHGIVQPPARPAERMSRGMWEPICPSCGAEMQPVRLTEDTANPYNQYALSKYIQELTALRIGRRIGVPSVALRYSITQGPRQSLYNQYSGICRIFTLRLLSGRPPIVFEDGRQQRDYVHVDDVVEANMVVLADDRADYEAFNVGSGTATTVLAYAQALTAKLGASIAPTMSGEYRVGDNRHSVSSIEKLARLGWAPRRGLSDILDDYVAWVGTLGHLRAPFEEADRAMRDRAVIRRAEVQPGGGDG